MKKIYLGLLALLSLFTACSDVELPASASDGKSTVSELKGNVPEGSRQLTLSWTNPAGDIVGIQIIQDDHDITELSGAPTSYLIKKAPTNVDVTYTVKARFADGTVSKGQTIRLYIPYEPGKGGLLAMLVPDDYATGSADEKNAVAWFQKNYVTAGAGEVITASKVDELDIEKFAACWVMCDRVGIDRGWQNLPGLAANEVVNALKAFCNDGGNLFLTNHATQLTVALGRISETYAPVIYNSGAPGGVNPDIWGVHPVIGRADLGEVYDHSGHEIFRGMTYHPDLYEGIYTFVGAGMKGDHNCMWDMNAIDGVVENPNKIKDFENKTNSTVLGTWNHVVDYCCAGIVDFAPTSTFAGRILAVGLAAYEWNIGGPNSEQDQLELFTANCLAYVGTPAESKVAMLVPEDYATGSADEKDAVAWFKKTYVDAGKGVILKPSTIDELDIETNPMCWVMCDRVGIDRGWQNLPGLSSAEVINALKAYCNDGGDLFLTNHATQLTVALGRISETYAPVIYNSGAPGGVNPDIWGVHPVIGRADLGEVYDHSGHEIFRGMTYHPDLYEGIYTFVGAGMKGDHNCMWDMNAIDGVVENPNKIKDFENKTNSTVLGTWNHVVDYCCAGIVDFAPTSTFAGRILAVGLAAYEWNIGGPNSEQDQLELFTANCIGYLK